MIRETSLVLSGASTEARAELPGLQPALYDLTVRPVANQDESTSAWVLALDSTRHRQGRDAYDAARDMAPNWDRARPRAVRSFLRAYLGVLAEELRVEP